MTRRENARFKRLFRLFPVLSIFLSLGKASAIVLLLFGSVASAQDAATDFKLRVRIAECLNSPAAQLFLMQYHRPFLEMADAPPSWQTLSANTPEELENLAKASVVGIYDMVFTSDEAHVQEWEKAGLLRDYQPLFREELILVGPANLLPSGIDIHDAMRLIFERQFLFLSLFHDAHIIAAEKNIWDMCGVKKPEENRQYVESGRDSIEALIQAAEEGGFLLVDEAAFAQYLEMERGGTELQCICRTGIYRTTFVCLIMDAGYRRERKASADRFFAWLKSEQGLITVESYELGGIKPFRYIRE